ncbi:MAG TPA: hypothetical protein PKA88_37210, partial [Polyangiaceae bacterium]|nr:hypothetical protein [Polyangiaceae bacterium]
MATTDEVFGIRTQLVLSYVERDEVDLRFRESLASDHHIVVYGSSKQGKTSLRQKHLPDNECLIVRCGPRMSIEGLYQSILRQSGARIQTIETRTLGATAGGKVTTGFKARIPFLGGGKAEVEASGQASGQQALSTEFVAYDFGDAQSISELLTQLKFKKRIVLENYHYLPPDTQRALAFDLKTFHEIGIRFLILGIWKEANLLVTHNGDLQDRIIEIPIEPWTDEAFDGVALAGSTHLNVTIAPALLKVLKHNAYGNVGLFQEFLKHLCLEHGVTQTQANGAPMVLAEQSALDRTIAAKLVSQRSALLKGFQGIAAKSRVRRGEAEQVLLLPYYLVQVVLGMDLEKLQDGVERAQLLDMLRRAHHRQDKETIRGSDVTNLLT